MKIFFYTFLFLLLTITSSAEQLTWVENSKAIKVGKYVEILEDKNNAYSIDEVSSSDFNSLFKTSEKEILSFGSTESYYWLKLNVTNHTPEELLVEFAQFSLPVCEMYFKDNKGQWQITRLGYHVNLNDRQIKDHYQVFPINGNTEYYFRVHSFSPPIPINIWEANKYEVKSTHLKIAYGSYFGLLAFVILYNIFLFISLNNRIHLAYSILVFLYLCIFSFVMDGFGMFFIPNLNLKFLYTLLPIVTMAFSTVYAWLFLDIKKYAPEYYRFALIGMFYFSSYIAWNFLLPSYSVMIINQIHALINLSFVAFLGHKVGQNGNKTGYYYSIAYYLYFGIVIFETIRVNLGVPPYLFGLSHYAIAVIFEVSILSYSLTKKFQWEKSEAIGAKLDAQKLVIEKTKENEQIVRTQNVRLEEQVERRTNQLNKMNIQLSSTLQTVEEEKAKSDALLLNILPRSTANELKENGFAQPRNFKNVTVLFTDFKDFTSTTSIISPKRLVEDLNECFMAFDGIVKELGLEKIKTIGDSYMAASGLPSEKEEHAIDAVECALKMNDFIKQWQEIQQNKGRQAWQMRIGIHSGPVIAGVVGAHKFAYDIWGDAVNTAARMESNSSEGKINISASTYDLIKQDYSCTSRGKINVKGKGDMEMYWVDN